MLATTLSSAGFGQCLLLFHLGAVVAVEAVALDHGRVDLFAPEDVLESAGDGGGAGARGAGDGVVALGDLDHGDAGRSAANRLHTGAVDVMIGEHAAQTVAEAVIADRADYEYAREIVARYDLAARVAAVHASPVHDVLHPRVLAEWVLADRAPFRVQLQLHKYIWDPATRGV